MALPTLSSRLLRSLARAFSEAEVKKLIGLSSAELTFLPVARRVCVCPMRSAVDWSAERLERIAAERMISDMILTFLGVMPLWRPRSFLSRGGRHGGTFGPAVMACVGA